jgi:hypothetical protein
VNVLVFFDIKKEKRVLKEAVVAYLKILFLNRRHDRSMSVVTRLQAGQPRKRFSVLGRDFSFL